MAAELKVPTLGMDMEEATILRWLVEEGTAVEKGDPVLEIETDKTSFEIEANGDGEIRNLHGEEGETLPVGAVLAYITAPGEKIPEQEETQEVAEPGHARKNGQNDSVEKDVKGADSLPESPDSNGRRRRLRASPAARRAADERGLKLEDVAGSGPNGRVYLSDVLEAEIKPGDDRNEEIPIPASATTQTSRREPLSRIRRIGAERTAKSFAEVPHFYLTRNLEVGRLLEVAERLGKRMEPAPGITELLVLAISRTLKEHPRLNARYAGNELELQDRVNLGVAVATDDGLVVPSLKGADTMPLRELVPELKGLIGRARGGRLTPEELSGGTFTISNLGMMGIDSFDAVINAPEAAILAVGRVQTVPEWEGGEWVPHRIISATLSVDHRVVDGAGGARFLADLQAVLTDWELLL
ncbi:MAG: dihydrolipoamide acetyltransferase family protein [Rubrobacteraceae bacterium]